LLWSSWTDCESVCGDISYYFVLGSVVFKICGIFFVIWKNKCYTFTIKLFSNCKNHLIQLFNHYQSSAKKNYKKYIEDESEPTVKKTLFIIRSVLMGGFIRQHNRFPNELNITKIHESISDFPIEYNEIEPLIQKKKTGNGSECIGNPVPVKY